MKNKIIEVQNVQISISKQELDDYICITDIVKAKSDSVRAAALMRPSKSTKDMELESLKKKYKSKGFAAGCSREVIECGANQLGWPLEKLLTMTLQAMADSEDIINSEVCH